MKRRPAPSGFDAASASQAILLAAIAICIPGCDDSVAGSEAGSEAGPEAGHASSDVVDDAIGTDQADALPQVDPLEHLEKPLPEFSEGMFPCSDCHDPDLLPVRTTRRRMKMAHEEIALDHGGEAIWCMDCHDGEDRDKLRLASGALLDFEQSHLLCGQCHGEQLRDWHAGVHGRRSGQWDGEKTYLHCSHCHAAHAPQWQPLVPEPGPTPPRRTR